MLDGLGFVVSVDVATESGAEVFWERTVRVAASSSRVGDVIETSEVVV